MKRTRKAQFSGKKKATRKKLAKKAAHKKLAKKAARKKLAKKAARKRLSASTRPQARDFEQELKAYWNIQPRLERALKAEREAQRALRERAERAEVAIEAERTLREEAERKAAREAQRAERAERKAEEADSGRQQALAEKLFAERKAEEADSGRQQALAEKLENDEAINKKQAEVSKREDVVVAAGKRMAEGIEDLERNARKLQTVQRDYEIRVANLTEGMILARSTQMERQPRDVDKGLAFIDERYGPGTLLSEEVMVIRRVLQLLKDANLLEATPEILKQVADEFDMAVKDVAQIYAYAPLVMPNMPHLTPSIGGDR